jgi:thiamine biosynthesis lipoprotein
MTAPNPFIFTHEAMATSFRILIHHPDRTYARQASTEAFSELDRIERTLSRFIDGSDVWRINRLSAGGSVVVDRATFDCLRIARDVHRITRGAFDVAYVPGEPSPREAAFELDDWRGAVRILRPDVHIDLGGIGKGLALDRMAALLAEWDVRSALLCAGDSTVLAPGPPAGAAGWPVSFGPDSRSARRLLAHSAFSASGRAVRGDHIIDARTGRAAVGWHRCWSAAPTAAVADALSTAFMAMSEWEIRACCAESPEVSAYALRSEGGELFLFADK